MGERFISFVSTLIEFYDLLPDISSHLYILYLAVDANFKLKGKDRGIQDPELGPGWGLFVEETRYQQHLANYIDQPEVTHLSIPSFIRLLNLP